MNTPSRPRALVVGLGIAGIATALRLRQIGWEPVIVERAPARRLGGYFIMLFGTGAASAQRLGVLDAIGDRNGPEVRNYSVNRAGHRTRGMDPASLPGSYRPRMLLRGDIEQALFEALPEDVEIRYSTVPIRIAQDRTAAEVTLHDTAVETVHTERFDLVVGADGMRSTVRRLAFGPEDHLHPLNYMIGAALLDGPVEGFESSEGLTLAEPGRSAWTFVFKNHAPSLLFSYRTDDVDAQFKQQPIDSIRAAFGPQPAGPILEHLFARFEQTDEALFDSVNQVRMPRWHEGRVVLIGDAAWCVSLYAGMGASSGMAGGDLLGTMLERHAGDVPGALREWEGRLRPFITTEQESAYTTRRLFTPHDRREHLARKAMVRLMGMPGLGTAFSKLVQGKDIAHKTIDIAAA